MAISRDAVVWGFRFFLGRDPGSEEAVEAHMRLESTRQLAEILLKSREFDIGKPFGSLVTVNDLPPALPVTQPGDAPPLRILVLGNCQAEGLARLLQAMVGHAVATGLELLAPVVAQMRSGAIDLQRLHDEYDLVFMHPHADALELIGEKSPALRAKLKLIPPITYSGFHPDLVYVFDETGKPVRGALGEYQSSLAFWGWNQGLTSAETIALFRRDVFEHLGFFGYERAAKESLRETGDATGIALGALMGRWQASGCWMYSVNHPRLFVLADVARALIEREGIAVVAGAEQHVPDILQAGPAWPVYPELAQQWGLPGNYLFKTVEGECPVGMPVRMLQLEEFVNASFQAFSRFERGALRCHRTETAPYESLSTFLAGEQGAAKTQASEPAHASAAPAAGTNPYNGLPDHQFWRRGVERVAMQAVDPVVRADFALAPTDRIATAGSCFAQHISRTLQKNGFNYYVAETAPADAPGTADRNFGVFSARFGNIYTARQLVQLFDRAYGRFSPGEDAWTRSDGRLVDPFRPQVEPEGFASLEELHASRAEHFEAVRTMFESLDVFVFTLGLTEAWRSKQDGAVFPLAPGVAGGAMDAAVHEFVNFGVADVVSDLSEFIVRLQRVNAGARMIVTVSPVPLIATYEARHVLQSTTYSKSVLRAAADEACRLHPMCTYFPSFEVITGNFNRGAYFDDDLRSVKPEGVEHVMRLFTEHYFGRTSSNDAQHLSLLAENARVRDIICDEEAIDRAPSLPPRGALQKAAGRLQRLARFVKPG